MTMISSGVAPAVLARRTFFPHGRWHVIALVIALAEAFAEAKVMARAADRRYPFVDW
jgi:hypothetical protein